MENSDVLEGYCCHALRIAVRQKVILKSNPRHSTFPILEIRGEPHGIKDNTNTHTIRHCPWCGKKV